MRSGWRSRLAEPVDGASIAVFRVLFGIIMAWEVWRYFENEWIRRYFITPGLHFTYFGFSWVSPWPGDWMYVHFLVLGVLALCIAAGTLYRIAAALFFVGFTYVFLLEQTRYLNHFYLVSLVSLLLIVVPAHRALSVDAWMRPALRSGHVPRWSLWLLRFQISIPYFYGGIAKINADWLRGEPPRTWLREWTDLAIVGDLVPVGQWFDDEWFVALYAWGGLILDLLIVPMLLWRRTRAAALTLMLVFHLANAAMFQLGIFPWFMIAATSLFLPPGWPRRLFRWPRRFGTQGEIPSARIVSRPAAALLATYVACQLLMPFRHFLYPGSVHWTEEGHRFSWHMKLRTKDARVRFEVRNETSGETFRVDPRDHMPSWQMGKMAGHPEKILQFAHYLARRFREDGHGDVSVFALAEASLNGRATQVLIDPSVDLARERRTLWHSPWIVPLAE